MGPADAIHLLSAFVANEDGRVAAGDVGTCGNNMAAGKSCATRPWARSKRTVGVVTFPEVKGSAAEAGLTAGHGKVRLADAGFSGKVQDGENSGMARIVRGSGAADLGGSGELFDAAPASLVRRRQPPARGAAARTNAASGRRRDRATADGGSFRRAGTRRCSMSTTPW